MKILKLNDICKVSYDVSCVLINIKLESLFEVYPFGLLFNDNDDVSNNFSKLKRNLNSIKLTKINSNNNSIFIDLNNIEEEVKKISLFINIFSLERDFFNKDKNIDKTVLKISLCNDAEVIDELKLLRGSYNNKFNTYKLLDIYKDEGTWLISYNLEELNTYHLELLDKLLK